MINLFNYQLNRRVKLYLNESVQFCLKLLLFVSGLKLTCYNSTMQMKPYDKAVKTKFNRKSRRKQNCWIKITSRSVGNVYFSLAIWSWKKSIRNLSWRTFIWIFLLSSNKCRAGKTTLRNNQIYGTLRKDFSCQIILVVENISQSKFSC